MQVLAALRSGDMGSAEAALERAYRDHARALLDFVTGCTGDPSVAAEVVVAVFVRLWEEPDSFGLSRSLRSSLVTEAYRRCDALVPGDVVAPDGSGRSSAWHRLGPQERLAIGLAAFGQMSTCEVAELLGVTNDSVKSTISEGLRRLAGAS
jgi:DNA-directed RNA polymerase specialized sigma24 family protein